MLCVEEPRTGERLTTSQLRRGDFNAQGAGEMSGKLELEAWLQHGCGDGLDSTISKGTGQSNQAPNLNLLK